jgi:hypothetical protein
VLLRALVQLFKVSSELNLGLSDNISILVEVLPKSKTEISSTNCHSDELLFEMVNNLGHHIINLHISTQLSLIVLRSPGVQVSILIDQKRVVFTY